MKEIRFDKKRRKVESDYYKELEETDLIEPINKVLGKDE